jgi:DNA-binding Lrp family transcriptional regulator
VSGSLDRGLLDAVRRGDLDGGTDPAAAETGERLAALEDDGVVEGYVPRLDYPALGYQTVIVRVDVDEDAVDAVLEDLRGPPVTDLYEVTGRYNVVCVGRFESRAALDAVLAALATDDRVRSVTGDVVLATACEYDTLGLLEDW